MSQVGFIGAGLMGIPMMQALLDAGHQVYGWNRTLDKLASLTEHPRFVTCTHLDQVAASCDTILICIADTQAVKDVIYAPKGLAKDLKSGHLLIDLSSIDPQSTRELSAYVQTRGATWVDAPVSGGVQGAQQKRLAIMCGGDAQDVARAQTYLQSFARQITHMGAVGCGQITKICNQMLVCTNALVIAEMMSLAQSCHVEVDKIPQALAGGFADSLPLQILAPQMAQEVFEPAKWHVRTLLKDLDNAVDLATHEQSAAPITGLAAQLMRLHAGNGFADTDPATLIQLYKQL
ncbi:3-hydroxyisobutyrate dehydrogenase [Allopseudospirillum japonicum]|uniref:3-hydroxyisobutyrate dehydrogenase n=2 Tax=Allopseudospirillum japonicum TaxID=64971 RepID=A0A1H6QBQ9_9GAMM|nr:3-hydroxyisobutyrate dehydrogenase [Allopseudospirillum japonicum]